MTLIVQRPRARMKRLSPDRGPRFMLEGPGKAPEAPEPVLLARPAEPPRRAPAVRARLARVVSRGEPAAAAAPAPPLRVATVRARRPVRREAPEYVAPRAAAAVPGADAVGVLGSARTTISMVPADLTEDGRVDITNFVVIALDAGRWA